MIWGGMGFRMQRALGRNFGCGGSSGGYFLAAALAGAVVFAEAGLAERMWRVFGGSWDLVMWDLRLFCLPTGFRVLRV